MMSSTDAVSAGCSGRPKSPYCAVEKEQAAQVRKKARTHLAEVNRNMFSIFCR